MSEKCSVCGEDSRPYSRPGDYAVYDHAANPEHWRLGYERVTAELAAAEERGRRRGVEEAAKIAEGLGDHMYAGYLVATRILAALAPRDSAPQAGITDEKIRELLLRGERDRRIAEGNNVEPRDSGKVEP